MSPGTLRLAGKVAVITGGSRGIGRALALGLAREGARIFFSYRQDEAAAHATVAEIRAAGGEAACVRSDASVRSDVKALFEKAAETFGGIDLLINNAGINQRCFFEEITDEDWDRIMGVNLKGPFICSQEVFPYMRRRGGGRIVNISSVAGQYHGPKTVHYAVSKAGLNSLTKLVARYGAPHNIIVNAIAPGIIYTDQTADELASPAGQAVIDLTLLKKPGQMQDVIAACLLLCSDEQSYITGQVISVSGGAYLG